ncbi:MAG: VIT domain-containing protein [Planctomycetota bacterium]
MQRLPAVVLALLVTVPTAPGQARRANPALALGTLTITADVVDDVATTELRQVVRNSSSRAQEADWVLPLPQGAIADGFSLWIDGVETPGEVLDADRARQVYQSIVRRRRDPGLLEYLGTGLLRARVFPIPPKGSAEVRVRYRHVLPETDGLMRWRFPLRAPQVDALRPEKVAALIRIASSQPIRNVFSPLPGVDFVRDGDRTVKASFELRRGEVADRDLELFYARSDAEFGLNALSYRREGEPGYFLLMIAPKDEWRDDEVRRKSIQMVLDTSGSMLGDKIDQARDALRFFVRSLRDDDRFNVVPFSTEAQPFFDEPVAPTPEHLEQALARIADVEAKGGTNLADGLTTALGATIPDGYVGFTMLLSDGAPTVGVRDPKELLALAQGANKGASRVFALGVGDDVNAPLIDQLAAQSGGTRFYVRPTESVEVAASDLLQKLSHPVLTDVKVAIEGVAVREVTPRRLPDLFKGSRVTLVGRYTGSGPAVVRLRGALRDGTVEHDYAVELPACETTHDFLPTLWAERRVAILLDEIRLHGRDPELLAEIQRLGKKHGIVTPFTAHLVVEETQRLAGGPVTGQPTRWRRTPTGPSTPGPSGPSTPGPRGGGTMPAPVGPATRSRQRLDNLGQQRTGAQAVADSRGIATGSDDFFLGGSRRAKRPPAPTVRHRAGRTFYFANGVWTDQRYDKAMAPRIRRIEAFSGAYFALLKAHPGLAPLLAVGDRVRVVWEDVVIETTPAGA